ncbi:Uncharacterized protein APZ42_007952, partial [Daphnia magna]
SLKTQKTVKEVDKCVIETRKTWLKTPRRLRHRLQAKMMTKSFICSVVYMFSVNEESERFPIIEIFLSPRR